MAEENPRQAAKPTTDESTELARPAKSRRGLILVILAVLVVAAVVMWWRSTYSEDTDDAQINGHLIQISSRIAGQVVQVNVEENEKVQRGELIAELDPRDFQVAVENAQAALESAQANAAAAEANVPITSVNTGSTLSAAN
ncbi:MAG: biotin/lipoyl-binding protein, partial [Terracidiphilus sp.]